MNRLLILLFCIPVYALAQNKPLLIEGISPNFYVNHLVAPKENYYSIGRMYNISPKEIAPFNNLAMEKGLSLGQTVKIPLTTGNFVQANTFAADEALIPVYHGVEQKEGLYHISVSYNKLPVETIKQWNNLKGDAVSDGLNLIVGYLKVKKELSPLTNVAKAMPNDPPAKPVENTNKNVVVKETEKPIAPKEQLPPAKEIVKEKPLDTPGVEKIKKGPAPGVVMKETVPEKKMAATSGRKNFNGGIFRADYEKQAQSKDVAGETGEAATFKSTSGWEDGKYYCLHNGSAPGTIVKITNTSTGKSIYAKVLDVIPDIKQNTGLLVRISNAAAEELGVSGDTKFDCTLSYSK